MDDETARLSCQVCLPRGADADLDRLFDLILPRGLARGSGDLTLPEQALAALRSRIARRAAARSPDARRTPAPTCDYWPFRSGAPVVPFEIEDAAEKIVAARRQLQHNDH